MPRDICPRCSSARLEPLPVGTRGDGGEFTADVTLARPDPPNMRCLDCAHEWWLAPRAAKIDPNQEGVAG